MAKVPGKLLKIYTGAGATPIDCLTDANIDMSAETIDVSCKDNETGWGGSIPGIKNGSLSGSGYLIDNQANSYAALFATFNAGAEIDWKFSAETTGTGFESGKGYITSLSRQGGVSDAIQFSFTISFSSAVTYTPIV